jgi:hypothetical protein
VRRRDSLRGPDAGDAAGSPPQNADSTTQTPPVRGGDNRLKKSEPHFGETLATVSARLSSRGSKRAIQFVEDILL